MKIKCSRRVFLSKSGFTLIELLVVVLIIGILAAVALPQYNRAVAKARTTEVQVFYNTLKKALASYYLEHGSLKDTTPDSFDIEFPKLSHWKYCASAWDKKCKEQSEVPVFRDWVQCGATTYCSGMEITDLSKEIEIIIEMRSTDGIYNLFCQKKGTAQSEAGNKEKCSKYVTCLPDSDSMMCLMNF